MSETVQSYAHHRRFLPPLHFFALPVLAINVIVTGVRCVQAVSFTTVWQVLVALALLIGILSARWMSVRVQDRLVRHEERSRITRLAAGMTPDEFAALRTRQLIGLRFAPDDEVVGLARRCVAGELRTRDEIKRAITRWRPDNLRV